MTDDHLPDDYEWFSDQIAGHHPSVYKNGKREIGILKKPGSDEILKLKQDGRRGLCEESVYRLLNNDAEDDFCSKEVDEYVSWLNPNEEDRLMFSRLVPRFYGTTQLHVDGDDHEFMMLADVSCSYRQPAILDIKMGRLTFDPNADAAKREKESSKYPPQMTLGFRILGYRIHRHGKVEVRDKPWGMQFNDDTIIDGLREFFTSGGRDGNEIKTALLEQMKDVSSFFEKQRSFHYYASSLLFLYETEPSMPVNIKIYMIDFSHVFPGKGERDENYLYGVRNLTSHLEKM